MIELKSDEETNQGKMVGENCCFCRKATPYWTNLKSRRPSEQVACCYSCAARGFPEDVPTKETWYWRERISTEGNVPEFADRGPWTLRDPADPAARGAGQPPARDPAGAEKSQRLFELVRTGFREVYVGRDMVGSSSIKNLVRNAKVALREMDE